MLMKGDFRPEEPARDEVRSLVGNAQASARLRDGQPRAFVWRNWFDQRIAEELTVLKQ
jgi:hypothetical protein